LGLYKAKLGREGVGFVGQDFEIASDAPAIAQVREARGILRGLEQEFFLRPEFSCLAICDQGVGYGAEEALSMNAPISMGCESITTWLEGTVIVLASILRASASSSFGETTRSLLATTNHDGLLGKHGVNIATLALSRCKAQRGAEAVSPGRIDAEVSASILDPIRAITEAKLLRLGRA
jgi:hypothetical protein